jgi:hypothetical protein
MNTLLRDKLANESFWLGGASAPAPAPLAPILDTFNRANGSLGANWGGAADNCGSYPMEVSSNQLIATQPYTSEYWTTTFGAHQMVYIQILALADNQGVGLNLCVGNPSSPTSFGYETFIRRVGSSYVASVYKWNSGCSYVEPGGILPFSFTLGDYFGSIRNGNDIELYTSSDGISWTLVRTITEASYVSGGYIGVYTENASVGAPILMDNFGGGTLS